ncbi:MAG: enoyl-CoA hydratase/isomerase [Gammaproteobacteria bacterium]|nr:enoyl-CoA hydratase/isomerase [Gammaproteobacteria bacterium]
MTPIVLERSGKIVTVTLDIPPVNTLSLERYQMITDTFVEIGTMPGVNCVVLTARGTRAFCAGLDLQEFLATTVEEDPHRAGVVRATFKAVRHCPIPVIAAVNGPALGAGAVLAAVSDIRIASEKATFAMPEINVGRCGGGSHLGRLLSPGMLRFMYFTGEPISAWEAYRIGLVEQLVAPGRLLPAAYELANIIAEKSPIGLRMAKEALNAVEFMQVEEGYELEQRYSTRLMQTEDAREAARAVVEKRPPVFVGR